MQSNKGFVYSYNGMYVLHGTVRCIYLAQPNPSDIHAWVLGNLQCHWSAPCRYSLNYSLKYKDAHEQMFTCIPACYMHTLHILRVVTKISSCRVHTTSRRGIKQLGISSGSIFLLFSNESSRGPHSQQPEKIPGPQLLKTTLYPTVHNIQQSYDIPLIKPNS